MKEFRYITGVSTLRLDPDKCVGCGHCLMVCPHSVFRLGKRAEIADHEACMECGACARNCPAGALAVSPGVGCAAYIIQSWRKKGRAGTSCC